MTRLWVDGALLIGLIGAGQALHDGSEVRIGSDTTMLWFVALQSAACVVYLACAWRVLKAPPPGALWLVLGVAAAMRAIPLASPMFLSSDLFRYIWDGRVQLAGINPYRYVPADPALAFLRDADIYRLVNRAATARTVYLPTAQAVFAALAWIGQGGWHTPRLMRAAMVCFEAVAVAAMAIALRRRGQSPARLAIYAWNPLAAWEFAGNGHIDALSLALLAVTLLARTVARPGLAGMALAGASLVKLLPAVVAPALWRRGDWRLPLAGATTALALYACYAGAGGSVFGSLTGYADEEGLRDGSGIWLLAGLSMIVPLPGWSGRAWSALVALGLLATAWHLSRRPAADPVRAAGLLMVATTLAIGPHYPWYYPWLAVPAVLSTLRSATWLGCAGLLLYLSPLHERFLWPALVFAPALVLLVLDLRSPPPTEATGD